LTLLLPLSFGAMTLLVMTCKLCLVDWPLTLLLPLSFGAMTLLVMTCKLCLVDWPLTLLLPLSFGAMTLLVMTCKIVCEMTYNVPTIPYDRGFTVSQRID